MLFGGFQHHPRSGFAALRRLPRHVWPEISRIDHAVSQLSRYFGLDCAILLLVEEAAPDSALVRDHDDFVSGIFEPAQRIRRAVERFNLFWIRAIIGVVDDCAVAINE